MRQLIIFFAAVLMSACMTSAERAQRLDEKARKVAQALTESRFTVLIHNMNTQRYGAHNVTSDFYLKLRGDTLESYLPFLGRAYSAPYGTPSQGLNFTSPVKKRIESVQKNGATRPELHVSSNEDQYRYQLDIFPNGQTYIHVMAQERDAVSFDGELYL
jgi:hypothetical protein